MKIETVPVEGVRVGERLRPLDPEKINSLAESMQNVGLLQPITVYTPDDASVELVAGLHRLEAARRLGWEQIDAVFIAGDAIDRELAEIAENLHRVDLTKEQRDQQIRRYAELLKARAAAKTGHFDPFAGVGDGTPGPGRGNKGIASQVAEQTGLSKSTVQRALNPKPAPKTPREPALDKRGDPDMHVVAHKLAVKHTVGELQELIDHLTDIIKTRLGNAA